MRPQFARTHLRCPACRGERTLVLTGSEADDREVREGQLRCAACDSAFPVRRGVAELMVDVPEHVRREAAGLGRFAELMRADGWTPETIRRLPDVDDGYWYVQGASIDQLVHSVPFTPGQWLLDLGSNTCWASNFFAARGLQVVALDISLWEMQGLYTSDFFIQEGRSYFERVLGSMNDIPLTSGSFDYVYACEVLHHNDPAGLRRTFQEAYRVLKPGGRMLVINETLKTVRDPVGVHTEGVAQFEGYEHAHWAQQYRWAAIRAGFATRLLEPSYHWFFHDPVPARAPAWRHPRHRVKHELRRTARGRRLYLSWVNNVAGGVSFGMIATKPVAAPSPRAGSPPISGRTIRSGGRQLG